MRSWKAFLGSLLARSAVAFGSEGMEERNLRRQRSSSGSQLGAGLRPLNLARRESRGAWTLTSFAKGGLELRQGIVRYLVWKLHFEVHVELAERRRVLPERHALIHNRQAKTRFQNVALPDAELHDVLV